MSNFRVTETRRQRTTTRAGYGASSNRSTFGYWVPLALTVTAATVGIVAWLWSERSSEDDETSSDEYYSSSGGGGGGGRPPAGYNSGGLPPGPGPAGSQGPPQPEWQGGQPPVAGGFQGYPDGPSPNFNQGVFQETRETQSRSTAIEQTEDTGLVARMSSALGIQRAPSPGQAYSWASKGISAGVAAAGAMVGINAMPTEHKEQAFHDQERWSEEAEQRDNIREVKQGIERRGTADEFYSGAVPLPRTASVSNAKRRTVGIVVSSEQLSASSEIDVGGHSSILAHLPEYVHLETTRIFVLIYAPTLQAHPLSPAATSARRPSQSMASSFSNISLADASTPQATTPGSFEPSDPLLSHIDPQPIDESTTTLYKTLHNQALALVDRDTMIMPFTSPQGHKHILKSLQPEILYIQEGMCGSDGEVVSELQGWVRTCVVVIGDEGGTGGLVDTDDEAEQRRARKEARGGNGGGQIWWKREDRTGLGRGVEVVEALKISDDWRKRVNSED